MLVSKFFESLGAPMVNPQWSWGAVSQDGERIYLKIWDHEILHEGGVRYARPVINHGSKSRGYPERLRHVEMVKEGVAVYCVVCTAKDPKALKMRIESFNKTPIRATLVQRHGEDYLQLAV